MIKKWWVKKRGYWGKNISLQGSWIKRLYDDSFYEWKIIPLHLISKTFGKSFIFYSNLSFKNKLIKIIAIFLQGNPSKLENLFF